MPSSDSQMDSDLAPEKQSRLKTKPMGQEYQEGEKNSAAQKVNVKGQEVEAHEKDWLRKKTDANRAQQGQEPATDESWREGSATTQYMNEEQREEHRMHLRPGRDATGAENMRLSGPEVKKGAEHIFAMDGEGQVFIKESQAATSQTDSTGRQVHVHHSSFLAGEKVAGAGELIVDKQGFINEVSDRSGHYQPGEAESKQALDELEKQGVNMDNVKFSMNRGEGKTTGMANEFRQGGEKVFKARRTMTDEIKHMGESVKEKLDHDASRRATRVRKAGEYLKDGRDHLEITQAAAEHAEKDAKKLKREFKTELGDQLDDQQRIARAKKAESVRSALGNPAGNKPAPPAQYSVSGHLK
ncbi:MAG: hypothetical protein IAE77_05450 [Prosthecobacter sp.]|jgi:hypothetical protein|uniref:hypothetical protein n=1 Tax=Prosthecobacter sp. TaxID=1965333 RepID=UPI0019EA5F2B|nr:hypothetical protein [Prosthecobacter sp.]MBE2282889.1 hypothetical protein [Prosthecobacter sp.]